MPMLRILFLAICLYLAPDQKMSPVYARAAALFRENDAQ